MGILDEITRINTNVNNMYTTLENMGVSVPTDKNTQNMSVTISNVIPRTPINCAGLCFWLDGDCNTRKGLDRSKKYFENLMWAPPAAAVTGNIENTSNYGNNVWIGNLLHMVDGYALYPQLKCTASNEYTIEVVLKMTKEISDKDTNTIFSVGYSNAVGGIDIFLSVDHTIAMSFKGTNGTDYSSFYSGDWKSLGLDPVIYAYFRVHSNSTDCGVPGINATNSVNSRPTAHSSAFNAGLGCSYTTGITSTSNVGSYALGMVRAWSRALSNAEIQANYQDAKARFGCI